MIVERSNKSYLNLEKYERKEMSLSVGYLDFHKPVKQRFCPPIDLKDSKQQRGTRLKSPVDVIAGDNIKGRQDGIRSSFFSTKKKGFG